LAATSDREPLTADKIRELWAACPPNVKRLLRVLVLENDYLADAKLILLGEKLETAWATWQAYIDGLHKEASNRYDSLYGHPGGYTAKMPAKLARQIPWLGAPGTKREYLTAGEYAILAKFAPKHPVVVWQKQSSKKSLVRRKESDRASKNQALTLPRKSKRVSMTNASPSSTRSCKRRHIRSRALPLNLQPSEEWKLMTTPI
jgi:hypothetical protein